MLLSAVYLTFANKSLLDYYLHDLLNSVEAISYLSLSLHGVKTVLVINNKTTILHVKLNVLQGRLGNTSI